MNASRFSVRLTCLAIAAAAMLSSSIAQATSWADTPTRPRLVPDGAVVHAVAPDAPVHVVVGLKLRNTARLDRRIANGRALGPLTRSEYLRDHAPSTATVAALMQHLKDAGFTKVQATPSRRLVEAVGTAEHARKAFQVTLAQVERGDSPPQRIAQAAPRLPADLAAKVSGVFGLQTSHLQLPRAATAARGRQAAVPAGAPDTIYAQDLDRLYNARSLPPAAGASVGLIGFGYMDWAIEDLNSFAHRAGYPTPVVRVVRVGPDSDDKSGADIWSEDSQLALAAAGGQLKETVLYAGWDISDASLAMTIDAAIEENKAQTLHFDILGDEIINKLSGWTDTVDAILQVGAAQGQSVMVVGGNNGSPQCFAWANRKELGYPAVSPYAIAVAGTSVFTNTDGEMRRQKAWRCSVGGVSETEPMPAWQTASGLFGGATGRVIPDVSLSTDAFTWWYQDWVAASHAGVSMATFAGLWARLQNAHGNGLGFAGPALYQAGVQRPTSFVDVVKGHNRYYSAGEGWDYVTGFGGPDVATFSSLLP